MTAATHAAPKTAAKRPDSNTASATATSAKDATPAAKASATSAPRRTRRARGAAVTSARLDHHPRPARRQRSRRRRTRGFSTLPAKSIARVRIRYVPRGSRLDSRNDQCVGAARDRASAGGRGAACAGAGSCGTASCTPCRSCAGPRWSTRSTPQPMSARGAAQEPLAAGLARRLAREARGRLGGIGTGARLRAGHRIVGRRLRRRGAGRQRAGHEESNGEEGSNGHACTQPADGHPLNNESRSADRRVRLSRARGEPMCSAHATFDPTPRALRSVGADRRSDRPRRDAEARVRRLRRPVARRRVDRQGRSGAAVRRPVRGVLARRDGRRVPPRVRAPGPPPRARHVGALEARAGGARRRRGVPRAARLPQPRHRGRRPGRVHPGVRAQPGDVPRPRRPALRARDERHLVPVVARPGRLPARVAADRPAVPVGGRGQRPLRLVPEPQPLPPLPDLAAQRPRLLARPPLRRTPWGRR